MYKPDFLTTLEFAKLDLGDIPPVVECVTTILKDDDLDVEGDEQIQMDLGIRMATETDIVVKAGTKVTNIMTKLADLAVRLGYLLVCGGRRRKICRRSVVEN